MTTATELSVVIPVLGNDEVLRRVLDGYARQQIEPDRFEVIVVIDAADPDPDAIRDAVGTRPYATRVLTATVPGASANRNVGWRAARNDLVLFTDSDTIPGPRLVAEHLAWHRANPEPATAVLGHVRWARGIAVTPFMRWLEQGVQFDFDGISGVEASWAHLYSANCSLTRVMLERVGGYDEERFPYGYEDLDLGYRAREHGLRVLYNRAAVVEHWRTMSVAQWQRRAPRLAVSERRFCERHPEVPPHFHALFAEAAAYAPGGRRSARAARAIPPRTPWLGPRIWARATLHWRQQIAPAFLHAWDAAGHERAFWDARALQDAYFFVDDRRTYGDPHAGTFWSDGRRDLERLLASVEIAIAPGQTVVDIGCGVGRLTRAIASQARHVDAIDISSEMLARAQRMNPELANVRWLQGDGRTLEPIADASADACISHVVFQHIPEPAITLGYVAEIARVLRPGGWAVFQFSNDPSIHARRDAVSAPGQDDPAWLGSALTLADVRDIATRSGLEVERVVGEGTQFCVMRVRKLPAAPPRHPD